MDAGEGKGARVYSVGRTELQSQPAVGLRKSWKKAESIMSARGICAGYVHYIP